MTGRWLVHVISSIGTAHDYGFADGAFLTDGRDVGVVVLDSPIPTSFVDEYASLAVPGSIDLLARSWQAYKVIFTHTGYGISGVRPVEVSFRERLMTTMNLIEARSQRSAGSHSFKLTGSPSPNQGGVCFGDSGGPVLYEDSNVIVGVSSTPPRIESSGVWLDRRS